MITASIDVTKIDKSRIKDGKWLNIVIDEVPKDKQQYGNTHSVYMSQSKEERADKAKRIYIGNGKEYVFQNKKGNDVITPEVVKDDLPF